MAYQQAAKYGIKYILSGHNYVSESVLPQAWGYNAGDATHLKAIQKRFGSVKLKTYPIMGLFKRNIWFPYVRRITSAPLLNYMPYHYGQVKEEITRRAGLARLRRQALRVGLHPLLPGLLPAHEVRLRQAARPPLVAHPVEGDHPRRSPRRDGVVELSDALRRQDHEFIAKKLGVTVGELEEIFARPPVDYTAYPNGKRLWDNVFRVTSWVGGVLRKLRILR